jgi:predicted Zn-dependent peptidase
MKSAKHRADKSAPEFNSGSEIVARDITQNHVCLGFPGPTLDSPERYVYDVMWCALGGGTTSRLFQRVREDEGLAYTIYTFHSAYFKAGMFGVYSAFAPESYDRTMELTFEEIRKFRDEPIGEQELDDNREQIKGSMLMSMESPFNRMSRMAKSMMYYRRIIPLAEVLSEIDAVTPERMQRLSREIFRPETCTMLVLGPETPGLSPEIAL